MNKAAIPPIKDIATPMFGMTAASNKAKLNHVRVSAILRNLSCLSASSGPNPRHFKTISSIAVLRAVGNK